MSASSFKPNVNLAFLENVLNAFDEPFYVIRVEDYQIVLANRAARDLGVKTTGALLPTCYALTHKRDTPCEGADHPCPMKQVIQNRQPYVVEHIHYKPDGTPYYAEVHGYPLYDAEGKVQYMVEYSINITKKKAAEERLRLLSNINQLIAREHDPKRLLEKTCQALVESGYPHACISLLQPDGASLKHIACAGASDAPLPECALQAVRARTLVSALPWLAVPLLRPNRTFGTLTVGAKTPFAASEMTLLQELADDLAYALENIEAENQRRAVAESAVPLLTARSESEFWSAALQAVQAVLRADRAAIYLYEYGTDRLTCPYAAGLSQEYIDEINRRFREAPGARIFRTPQPVPVNDTESDPSAAPLRPLLLKEGIRAYCVFPLFSAQKLLGAFVSYRNAPLPFSQADLEAGQTLAHLVAVSLQNVRLFAETRAKASEQAALFIAAQEMSASLLNPSALLETFAKQLATVLDATSVYVISLEPDGKTMKVISEYWAESASLPERKSDLGRIYQASDFPHVVQSMRSGKPLTLQADEPDLTDAERNEYLEYVTHTKLFIPLMWQGQVVGYIEIWESRRKREFTQHEIHLAQALSAHAASVIHAANLFAELEKREAHFRAIIEHSAEGVAILDAEGNIRYIAPAEERLTGYNPKEAVGQSAFANIHPEDVPAIRRAFERGIQQPDATITLSYRLRRADGEWRHYEATGHNLLHDPFIQGVVVNYRDITDRKRVEAELEKREAYFRALIENAVDGIAILNRDAAFCYLSPSVERILGYHPEELMGCNAFDHIHPDDQHSIMTAFAEGISKPNIVMRIEFRFRHRDGRWLYLEAVAHNLLQDPIVAGIVVNYRDITDRKQAEENLIQAYDSTLEGWAHALELRDKDTEGHTRRVTELAVSLARAMNVPEEQLIHIRRGATLHDIGKVAVPDRILHKPAALTAEEMEIMRQHPRYAYEMLSRIEYLRPSLEIPYCHHEHWDGSGYPRGLKGEEIPLAARIFAVVDVYDALTSDRPYRPDWSKQQALQYIREHAGSFFDPQVVETFLFLSESGDFFTR